MPLVLRFAIAWAINIGALWIANALWDGVAIKGAAAYLIGGAVLAIANAIIKPVLAVLTLPLILATFGLFYLFLSFVSVFLAEWIAPHFSIDGFWSYVGVVVVVWVLNWAAHELLDYAGLDRKRRGRFSVSIDRRR
jgi:putative membrane protein